MCVCSSEHREREREKIMRKKQEEEDTGVRPDPLHQWCSHHSLSLTHTHTHIHTHTHVDNLTIPYVIPRTEIISRCEDLKIVFLCSLPLTHTTHTNSFSSLSKSCCWCCFCWEPPYFSLTKNTVCYTLPPHCLAWDNIPNVQWLSLAAAYSFILRLYLHLVPLHKLLIF